MNNQTDDDDKQEWEWELAAALERYEDNLAFILESDCVMCGKEGAMARSNHGYYCSQCWTIWNS